MTIEEFEHLVTEAGLILLLAYPPRFLVSLHVETKFGIRMQCGKLLFSSREAFRMAEKEETISAIEELRQRLSRASQTQQGDVAKGGTVEVKTANVRKQVAIGYPAH
jgi:hypothetical protein